MGGCLHSIGTESVANLIPSSTSSDSEVAQVASPLDITIGDSAGPGNGIKRKHRTPTFGKRKNMMQEAARKAFLERDKWTRDVQPRSVTCGGCHKTLSLDKRNGAYYSSLWSKHRAACRSIRRLEGENGLKTGEVRVGYCEWDSWLLTTEFCRVRTMPRITVPSRTYMVTCILRGSSLPRPSTITPAPWRNLKGLRRPVSSFAAPENPSRLMKPCTQLHCCRSNLRTRPLRNGSSLMMSFLMTLCGRMMCY
jgi:hypothetical protein